MTQKKSLLEGLPLKYQMDEMKKIKIDDPINYRKKMVIGIFFIIIAALLTYTLFKNTQQIDSWVKSMGSLGPLFYLIFLSIAVVLLFPTPILKIFSGALFGFSLGSLINFASSVLGGFIAFILGRWMLRDSIKKIISKNKKVASIEKALSEDGMRVSILVRLSPILPDEWLNYALSTTSLSLKDFMISSISSLLYALVYSYYGSVLGSLAFSSAGIDGFNRSPLWWAMTVIGVIATIVVTVYTTRIAMKALEEYQEIAPSEE